jgi:hypothetical protein
VLIPSAAHAKMFSGKYSHRTMTGGIGHNRPEKTHKHLPKRSSTSRPKLVGGYGLANSSSQVTCGANNWIGRSDDPAVDG